MTPTVIVQREAEGDLTEAFIWYERRREGLGYEFLAEIDGVFQRIARNPLLIAPVHRETRRGAPRRFPYVVFYVAREDSIYVLAVLHQRRDPKIALGRSEDFNTG